MIITITKYVIKTKCHCQLAKRLAYMNVTGTTLEVTVEVMPRRGCQEFGFRVLKDGGNQTVIGYRLTDSMLFIDTSQSGDITPTSNIPQIHQSVVALDYGKLRLHFFLDWSTLELFADCGCAVHSVRVFPPRSADDFEFYVRGGDAVVDLTVHKLKSIWT